MGKMYAVISFYLGAFEWICFCLKWKKGQFIFATVNTVMTQQNAASIEFERVAKRITISLLPTQSSHHPIQQLTFR